MKNTYISIYNVKAIRHFIKLGYTLTYGIKTPQWASNIERLMFGKEIYYIDWSGSGRSFRKYLKKNGLMEKKPEDF